MSRGLFLAAESLLGLGAIWVAIESAQMPESARILLFERTAHATRGHMADLLRSGASGGAQAAIAGGAPTALAADLAPGMQELDAELDDLLSAEARARSAQMRDGLVAAGAGPEAAAMVARLFDRDGTAGLARLARDSGIAAPALARAFSDLGSALGIGWAQSTAARMSPSNPWERLLVAGLAGDFQHMRLDFLRRLLRGDRRRGAMPEIAPPADAAPCAMVRDWLAAQEPRVRQFHAMVARAQAAGPLVTPAILAQIASQARGLLAR